MLQWSRRKDRFISFLQHTAPTETHVYLDGFLVALVGGAPVGGILPMDSAQEVQLNCMLGHPVLELIEELTAAR